MFAEDQPLGRGGRRSELVEAVLLQVGPGLGRGEAMFYACVESLAELRHGHLVHVDIQLLLQLLQVFPLLG